jgi:alpha-galactosidase
MDILTRWVAGMLGVVLTVLPVRAVVPPPVDAASAEGAVVLTPRPGPAPRINGPKVYGCRPGHPFLYRIPCTGERPMNFAADGLPPSLTLDSLTGVVTGVAPASGEYDVTLRAENGLGKTARPLRIVSGDTLCLTPPMGWNHWYTHFNRVTDEMIRLAADRMVESGMADAGYQYVSIDDCWMRARGVAKYMPDKTRVGPTRDKDGNILPNEHFPDMKALADYLHGRGLKVGIYTSPGPSTCTGCEGAYRHEAQDARQFAAWGFDLLKYDWCSYGRIATNKTLPELQKPYRLMGDLLKKQDRDIALNLCQYGMGEVWKWGAEVGGQSWRTGGDLGFELRRIFEIALKNVELCEYNRPGAWNDPDYLQIGWIGAQRNGKFELSHPCPLLPNEQYSFMALWCLMASPLFFSGDMEKLDAFTLGILCSPEMIEINQDPLGQCARLQARTKDGFVLVKKMADGSWAVGFCNSSGKPAEFGITWSDLGLAESASVRDCWRMRDLGMYEKRFTATMPPRFVGVYRVGLQGP